MTAASRMSQPRAAGLSLAPLAAGGASAGTDDAPTAAPPVLDDAGLYGPVGDWVRLIAPHTEASPAALMFCAVTAIGAIIGRGPHVELDGARHGVNLFTMLVGPTAAGRKGTAVKRVTGMLKAIDPDFARRNVTSGLSSGQGLIHRLRDARAQRPGEKQDDPGVDDKRMLVVEAEFASALKQTGRDGNTLSAIVREAYDGDTLRTMTKGDPMVASDPHVAIIAQITPEELKKQLNDVEMFNGFLNRFLLVWTERSQLLPFGSEPDAHEEKMVLARLASLVGSARNVGAIRGMTPEAREWWARHYGALTTGQPGRAGAATQRGAAHVRRMAMLFALSDGKRETGAAHLVAAYALWQYATGTVAYLFGGSVLSDYAARIESALRNAGPDGLDRTAIREKVIGSNNVPESTILAALGELRDSGAASQHPETTRGRPREVWVHITHKRCNVVQRNGSNGNELPFARETAPLPSHPSHFSAVDDEDERPAVGQIVDVEV